MGDTDLLTAFYDYHCSADYELSAYVEYVGSALGCIRSLDNADTVNADARLRG